MYGLYLYFPGLSFRNVSRAIEPFIQRSHVAVWEWVQKFNHKQIYPCKRVSAFLIDETMVQIGDTKAWLWIVAVEPVHIELYLVFTSQDIEICLLLNTFYIR
jgi:transposase-like protein